MALGDPEDGGQEFAVEGVWDGVATIATVIVDADTIEFVPVPGKRFSMPMSGFEDLIPKALVASHARRPPD